jgi:hypothetical protein
MATKLTLRMDESVIEQAKKEARRRGTSVSRLVASYFERLKRLETDEEERLPPITRRLRGIAASAELTEEDYRRHLEEKHR